MVDKMLSCEQERVIIRKGDFGYREYRIPGILPVDGAILFCFEARKEKMGDWGDIDVQVWRMEEGEKPEKVLCIGESHLPKNGTMRTYNNPVLIPDGENIHLIYHKNYARAFICTSQDQGRTWKESREITQAYREAPYEWNVCATGPGHGLQMKNGRLIAPIWLANGEKREDGTIRHWPSVAGCIYSDDHGQNWHAGHIVKDMQDGNETSAAELPNGQLLFNYRNRENALCRWLGISENGEAMEQCWQAENLPDPMCFGGMASAAKGALFANCHSQEKRINIGVRYTKDEGHTWEDIWVADSIGGYVDIGYRNQKIYLFFERTSYENNIIEELVLKISEKTDL
ncbi:MAG: exo-alpha-sialidase [Clostridiales bacterium]|nr:exo-alpha-sialidase [Clostridiales bacterium]